MKGNKKTELRTLPEQIAEKIIDMIIKNAMQPGDKLGNEYELAERLSVGRSTIREAIKILASRNILEIRQGAGTFVSSKHGIPEDPLGLLMTSANKEKSRIALDLLEIRLLLEPEIAQWAARNATATNMRAIQKKCDEVERLIRANKPYLEEDYEFHELIAQASGNLVVNNVLFVIRSAVDMFIDVTKNQFHEETIHYHREIANAISERDCNSAKYAMIMHLNVQRAQIRSGVSDKKEMICQKP